jgi:hypothetical protein
VIPRQVGNNLCSSRGNARRVVKTPEIYMANPQPSSWELEKVQRLDGSGTLLLLATVVF